MKNDSWKDTVNDYTYTLDTEMEGGDSFVPPPPEE